MMSDSLTEAFAVALGVPKENLNDDSTPETVDDWDSIATLAVITEVEKRFGIRVTVADAAGLTSIGAWRQFVNERVKT
jgi:acyl carrier protein